MTAGVRVRLDIAYDGTHFCGWAAQPGLRSVEQTLSTALATILRTEPSRLTTAGRTDAGVHATGAVVHVDVDVDAWHRLPGRSTRAPEEAAAARLNGVLPDDLVVTAATVAPPGFDARFSALSRRYRYRLTDQPANPLRRHDTVSHRSPLDVGAMDAAASQMVGLHDFAAFCKRREGATTVRHLLTYAWERDADGVILGHVVADAFCHSMVRALVGAVVPVGEGRMPVTWPAEVLAAGQRDPRVAVMPAHGLTLVEVTYPDDHDLVARAEEARSVRTLPC